VRIREALEAAHALFIGSPLSAVLVTGVECTCNEQTAQRTPPPTAATGIEIQLACGTWYCLDQWNFAGNAVRLFPAKSALSR
jgi:hypothetical protein